MDAPDDLDATVKRGDPDRWLASRFIDDATARADVVALYALNLELARIADAVREPLMGEIRLTWWREAIEEIFAGRPVRRHPVTQALASVIERRSLAVEPFEAMIEARFADLAAEPFGDLDAIEAYIDATAGGLMGLVTAVLGAAEAAAVTPAARAWGLAGLARIRRLPRSLEGQVLVARVRDNLAAARTTAASLPVPAFPALAYVCLAKPYAAGRTLSELEKRARLMAAVLRGRL